MSKKFTLGYCLWLLGGTPLPERIQFVYDHGFRAVAKLQSIHSDASAECREAARLIARLGMTMTCHTNVHGNLKGGHVDWDFARAALADDLWWNEATGGAVHSCCTDTVTFRTPDQKLVCLQDETMAMAELEQRTFAGTKIGSGIENSCSRTDDGPCYAAPAQFGAMAAHAQGLLFDAGHANIAIHSFPECAGLDLETYLDAIPLTIHEVHVSDNHGKEDEHLAPRCGNLDFAALRRGLEKRPETPVVSLEFCRDIMHGLLAHDLTVPAERARVVRAMETLAEWLG